MERKFLSKMERAIVEELRANTRDKGAYMKLSVLILLDMDKNYGEIAEILGIGLGTVSNCRSKYEKEGLEKYLDTHYVPYTGKLSDEELSQLDQAVSSGLYQTTQTVQTYIEDHFGISYSLSAVLAILTKLDFVYKKTMSVPGKADLAQQEAFLQEMEPFLAEIDVETEAVYFLDAVHPQHNTRPNYAWVKRGEDKAIATNSGRKRLNLHGALNAHQPEDIVIQEAETIDGFATITLCEQILAQNSHKETIYLFADNASYYHGELLQSWLNQHPKMVFIYLPTYSPNLNLIERLWKFMRKKVIDLNYYPTFKLFRQAIFDFFDHIKQYKSELRTLMRHNFQRMPAVKVL